MHFTAHNIVLADGTETKPGSIPVANYPRTWARNDVSAYFTPEEATKGFAVQTWAVLKGATPSVGPARASAKWWRIEVRKANSQ